MEVELKKELQDIYDEYLTRTKYAMNNFIILRAIDSILKSIHYEDISPNFIEILDKNLIASDDYPDNLTTKTNIKEIWEDVQKGDFITKITIPTLVELVAALDEAIVQITQLYIPYVELDKVKKKSHFKVRNNNRTILIHSKTLCYAYAVYRHCYNHNDKFPTFFNINSDTITKIHSSILIRHWIIHNNAKLNLEEKNNFTWDYLIKYLTSSNELKFDNNQTDDVFHFHAINLRAFLVWLQNYADIYLGTEFKPKPELQNSRYFFTSEE